MGKKNGSWCTPAGEADGSSSSLCVVAASFKRDSRLLIIFHHARVCPCVFVSLCVYVCVCVWWIYWTNQKARGCCRVRSASSIQHLLPRRLASIYDGKFIYKYVDEEERENIRGALDNMGWSRKTQHTKEKKIPGVVAAGTFSFFSPLLDQSVTEHTALRESG